MRAHRILALVLSLFVMASSGAQTPVQRADSTLFDSAETRALSRLYANLDFPNTPLSQGAVVDIFLTATGGKVMIVGPVGGDAQAYAAVLNEWSRCVHDAATVKWSQESIGAAARLTWGKGSFGSEHAEQTIAVGKLVQAVKAKYRNAKIALRYIAHALPARSPSPDDSTRAYSTYDVSNVEPDYTAHPTATLPSGTSLLFWLFVAFVPVATGVGFISATIVGSRKSLPLSLRRRYYSKLVQYTSVGGIGVHSPFAFYLIFSGTLKPVADLWFGSTTLSAVMTPFLLMPLALLIPAAKAMGLLERKLFGATEEEKSKFPDPLPIPPEVLRRLARRSQAVRTVGSVGMMIVVFSAVAFDRSASWRWAPLSLGFALVLFSGRIVRPFFRPKPGDYAEKYRDAGLEKEALDLAAKMGTTIGSVQVDRGVSGVISPNARVDSKGNVTVTARAMQVLEPAERHFLLAHELAHQKLGHVRTHFRWLVLPALILTAPMAYLFLVMLGAPRLFPPGVGFILVIVGWFYSLLFGRKMRKQHELDADRLALQTTGDLNAAESALTKIAFGSPMPHMHDLDDLASHPALSRRIASLRAATA